MKNLIYDFHESRSAAERRQTVAQRVSAGNASHPKIQAAERRHKVLASMSPLRGSISLPLEIPALTRWATVCRRSAALQRTVFQSRKLAGMFGLCLLATVCAPRQQPSARDQHIAAASLLTKRCAASRLAKWNIRGIAAGNDCSVLLVDTSMVLDDSLTEAIHYGTGAYAVVDGGVWHFSLQRAFRGVAYRDRTGHLRTYGNVTQDEAEELQPCR